MFVYPKSRHTHTHTHKHTHARTHRCQVECTDYPLEAHQAVTEWMARMRDVEGYGDVFAVFEKVKPRIRETTCGSTSKL